MFLAIFITGCFASTPASALTNHCVEKHQAEIQNYVDISKNYLNEKRSLTDKDVKFYSAQDCGSEVSISFASIDLTSPIFLWTLIIDKTTLAVKLEPGE